MQLRDRQVSAERPIEDFENDRLDRRAFVERLVDGLITSDNSASRGVVMGITGPWGSGKSSILNLVDLEVKRRCPQAIVVRFDPWVISGHHDLILSFLREAIRTVAAEPKRAKAVRGLLEALAKYATYLEPVLEFARPGIGKLTRGVVEGLHKGVEGDQTLVGQKKRLGDLITSLNVPIVVLIDELDRVEDEEVRAVAQLVRAVGDFPGISYLLAYDPKRVAEALGRGDSVHGRAYLEKIVQLPLRLPVTLPSELRRMLDIELDRVLEALKLAGTVRNSLRYDDIAEAITPDLAATPRDIKRVVGVFHPLMAMVEGEVDTIDVLGFAALMTKAPLTIEAISANPESVVDDPLTFAETVRRIDLANTGGRRGPIVIEQGAEALSTRLFPVLSGRWHAGESHANAISQRAKLMTVLRLGLSPGNISMEGADHMLFGTPDAVQSELERSLKDDTLAPLVDRLTAVYSSNFLINDLGFWRGAARFLNLTTFAPEDKVGRVANLASSLASMLEGGAARRPDAIGKPQRIIEDLLREDDLALAPRWIASHLEIHGIGAGGYQDRDGRGGPWFMSFSATVATANNCIENWRNAISRGNFFNRLSCIEPLEIMIRLDSWDERSKVHLRNNLASHVTNLAVLMYGPSKQISPEFAAALCDPVEFEWVVRNRLTDENLNAVERKALEQAQIQLAKVSVTKPPTG